MFSPSSKPLLYRSIGNMSLTLCLSKLAARTLDAVQIAKIDSLHTFGTARGPGSR